MRPIDPDNNFFEVKLSTKDWTLSIKIIIWGIPFETKVNLKNIAIFRYILQFFSFFSLKNLKNILYNIYTVLSKLKMRITFHFCSANKCYKISYEWKDFKNTAFFRYILRFLSFFSLKNLRKFFAWREWILVFKDIKYKLGDIEKFIRYSKFFYYIKLCLSFLYFISDLSFFPYLLFTLCIGFILFHVFDWSVAIGGMTGLIVHHCVYTVLVKQNVFALIALKYGIFFGIISGIIHWYVTYLEELEEKKKI